MKGLDTKSNQKFVSTVNAFKMRFEAQALAPPAVYVFKPLTSWPAKPHERQADLDSFRAIPSRLK